MQRNIDANREAMQKRSDLIKRQKPQSEEQEKSAAPK
jgi:hypothetical protein